MKQKQSGSAHIILLGILVILIGGTLTYSLLKALDNKSNTQLIKQQSDQIAVPAKQPADVSEAAKAEAIYQAEQYSCPAGTMSTMDMKPATHTATGAKYTFGGCIAPGWERDEPIYSY